MKGRKISPRWIGNFTSSNKVSLQVAQSIRQIGLWGHVPALPLCFSSPAVLPERTLSLIIAPRSWQSTEQNLEFVPSLHSFVFWEQVHSNPTSPNCLLWGHWVLFLLHWIKAVMLRLLQLLRLWNISPDIAAPRTGVLLELHLFLPIFISDQAPGSFFFRAKTEWKSCRCHLGFPTLLAWPIEDPSRVFVCFLFVL